MKENAGMKMEGKKFRKEEMEMKGTKKSMKKNIRKESMKEGRNKKRKDGRRTIEGRKK